LKKVVVTHKSRKKGWRGFLFIFCTSLLLPLFCLLITNLPDTNHKEEENSYQLKLWKEILIKNKNIINLFLKIFTVSFPEKANQSNIKERTILEELSDHQISTIIDSLNRLNIKNQSVSVNLDFILGLNLILDQMLLRKTIIGRRTYKPIVTSKQPSDGSIKAFDKLLSEILLASDLVKNNQLEKFNYLLRKMKSNYNQPTLIEIKQSSKNLRLDQILDDWFQKNIKPKLTQTLLESYLDLTKKNKNKDILDTKKIMLQIFLYFMSFSIQNEFPFRNISSSLVQFI